VLPCFFLLWLLLLLLDPYAKHISGHTADSTHETEHGATHDFATQVRNGSASAVVDFLKISELLDAVQVRFHWLPFNKPHGKLPGSQQANEPLRAVITCGPNQQIVRSPYGYIRTAYEMVFVGLPCS
jgi:hypothetical protein